MIKEENKYKFIEDIDAAKRIFKELCFPNEIIDAVNENELGEYNAEIYLTHARQKIKKIQTCLA